MVKLIIQIITKVNCWTSSRLLTRTNNEMKKKNFRNKNNNKSNKKNNDKIIMMNKIFKI